MERIAAAAQKSGITFDLNAPSDQKSFTERKCRSYNETTGNMNEVDGYDCPICRNKGLIMEASERQNSDGSSFWYEAMFECKCMSIRESLRRMQRSGLADVISKYTFENYEATEDWQKTIKDRAKRFPGSGTPFFFIAGQSGSGKSHICTAICRRFLRDGKSVKYMLWMEESKRLKSLLNTEEYDEAMAAYRNVDVLYIDDFLKTPRNEEPSEGDLKIAIELINSRYISKGKRTLISTEFTVDDIIDMDESMGSRIVERCNEEFEINMPKDSRRNYRLRKKRPTV